MRTLWRIIVGCLTSIWRVVNFIREFTLNLFLLFLILVCAGIYFELNSSNVSASMPQGALKIDLVGIVVDKPSVNNQLSKFGRHLLGTNSERMQEYSLFDVVNKIRQAKNDKNINGIVLDLHNFIGTDQPSLGYIGKALSEFRDSGKPIYATGDNYSQAQYYLASFANTIYLSPKGVVDLHGFAINTLYFKSLLDKLKVTSHIFRVGTYKSAVEPFIRDDMSPAVRDANNLWINELWQNYLATIADNRHLTPQQIFPGAQGVLDGLKKTDGDSAQYAKENKLVDELASRAIVQEQLVKKFNYNQQLHDYNHVSIYDYALKEPRTDNGNVAVILASGAIIDGEQTPSSVGGDTTVMQIREARLNPKIKAIILRINSPGGSVSASEVIRQELTAVREAGKPIVVSMGGMAASGGYWISTPANYIIASKSTLTGSIGIFGMINTVENSLDAIGVHTDGVATSPLADVATTKTLPNETQQLIQLMIDRGYQDFINLVAQSRHKTPEEVDQIAQGHVWSGVEAKSNGLVDELGDFDNAVAKAVQLANLKDYQLRWIETKPTFFNSLLNSIDVSAQATLPQALKSYLPRPMFDTITKLKKQSSLYNDLGDPQNRYALCLTCGDVQ